LIARYLRSAATELHSITIDAGHLAATIPPKETSLTQIVTDKDWDAEVLKSKQPVIVDFFAEWCQPCKAMAPALDQVATEMAGKVKIVKIDVDQNPVTSSKYGIRAMPTLMAFKDGKKVNENVGALVQKTKLEAWIKSAV
jgi:thioredoxin 1